MSKVKINKILTLNPKKLLLIFVIGIGGVVAHNLLSALLGVEEAVFFILSVLVIPVYFLLASLYMFWQRLSKVKDSKKAAKLAGLFLITAYGVLVSEMTQSELLVMVADIISGLSVVGIAVLLYPFFKKKEKDLSKFYLYLKWVEGLIMIFGGILFLLGLKEIKNILYDDLHIWVFIVSGFAFYYLLYKTKLVPKFISIWGLIAISSLLIQTVLGQLNISNSLIDSFLILIITNEIFLAGWLITKGVEIQSQSQTRKKKQNKE